MGFDISNGGTARLAPVLESARDERTRTGCDVQHEGRRARVRLWGALPFTWCGNLSLHCHGAGVSIVEADARHLGRARWAAALLVERVRLEDEASLHGLDFLAMARHRPALVPLSASLGAVSFRLEPPGPGGAARLTVSAPDRLGLLANLLAPVMECGLRPREICARTRGGRAEDWLALEGQAGTAPSVDALEALEEALREAASIRPEGYLNK